MARLVGWLVKQGFTLLLGAKVLQKLGVNVEIVALALKIAV
jgi:hypothetical protein